MDAGYLSKVELEDRVSAISEEFKFLTALYDAVHSIKENIYIQYVSSFCILGFVFLLLLYVLFY